MMQCEAMRCIVGDALRYYSASSEVRLPAVLLHSLSDAQTEVEDLHNLPPSIARAHEAGRGVVATAGGVGPSRHAGGAQAGAHTRASS